MSLAICNLQPDRVVVAFCAKACGLYAECINQSRGVGDLQNYRRAAVLFLQDCNEFTDFHFLPQFDSKQFVKRPINARSMSSKVGSPDSVPATGPVPLRW